MKLSRTAHLLGFVLLFAAISCAVKKDFYLEKQSPYDLSMIDDVYHTIYFLGGSDEVRLGDMEPGSTLNRQMDASGKNSTLLLLGNNSLRHASLKLDSSKRSMERIRQLRQRYNFFSNLEGNYYAVLGPHEWSNGNKRGKENARILEEIVEEELMQENIVRPASGCPGPEEIPLGDKIVLLLIDTQWLFHPWDKPNAEDGCTASGNLDFYVNLDDAIKRNYNKRIIVAGYHSLEGNGRHGGYYPAKSHFIPLPVIGSIGVGIRAWMGNPTDLTNPGYKVFVNTMKDLLKQHEDIIYLSAHEKTLEHHESDGIHILNSGSFSKGVEVGQQDAMFASGKRGYGRILFRNNGECILEYWGGDEKEAKLVYQAELFSDWSHMEFDDEMEDMDQLDYTDSTKTTYASLLYTKKQKRKGMLGNNYREEWVTELSDVPYFDIGTEKGGLKILKRGGGQQTKSLRLENPDKKQYVLRSIEKYPESAVPTDLRNTIAVDIVTDQISAAHPYGAFGVPKMAEAAGIYHTNPRLVYLPDDPRLGIYRHTFGDGLYLFEERPAKNRDDIASFGRSKDIVNTLEVLKETRKDGDHYVDQVFTLRSRLFDIFIGDWDRHDDQWRWASFRDENDFKYYRPIPRDRDQAFFWSDGWLLNLASRNWGIAKFQGFHDHIRDVDGLSFNARYFDRTFLTSVERDVWISIAQDLKERLTDEIIESSIKDFPKEIYALKGEEIIRKLKQRRDDLVTYAEQYYEFLAKEVDVLGSDKREHFIIERLNDEQTKVTGYLLRTKSGEIKRKSYERTFLNAETDEIRIYGFNGDDLFEIKGDVSKSTKVRIIGGKGDDTINDVSAIRRPKKQTVVYDTKTGTEISGDGKVKNNTSDKDPLINDYNRKMFQYNVTMPLVKVGFNPDDKIFLGGGVMIKRNGFRKYPFKSQHVIMADFAPVSQSYEFSYKGTFTEVVGKWDFRLNARIFAPSYTDYFYGYGNESEFDITKINNDLRHYSARYVQYIFYPELIRRSKDEVHELTIGGGYQSVNVREDLNDINAEQERFIVSYAKTLDYQLFDVQRHYVALYANYQMDRTNSPTMPLQGFKWNLFLIGLEDVDDKEIDVDFQRVRSDLSYYYTFGKFLKATLALRVGGVLTNGKFEFYHAAKIGGTDTFRGVRKFRFAGQDSFYQNTDLRLNLFQVRNTVVPIDVGMVLFHDFGRVWYDDPNQEIPGSNTMHRAYGGGLWIAPLNLISIGADYSWSTLDEKAFFIRMGFFF